VTGQASSGQASSGRLRRVAVRSVLVLVVGAAVLVPILWYASTVDVRPPQVDRVAVTQHLPGDSSVALTTASLEVVFSEDVDHASAQAAFAIDPDVTGAFSWSGTTMIFTPTRRLPLETHFSVTLRPGVRDLSGNVMGAGGPFGFRTVGSPSVVAVRPAADATGVALDAPIVVTFSTLMDTASVQSSLDIVPHTDVDLQWAGTTVTIVPRQMLAPDQDYLVVIGTGATDLAGTALDQPLHLAFSTVPAGLHVRAVLPQDTAQGIAVTTSIAVILDRALDPSSVEGGLLSIEPSLSGSLSAAAPEGAAGMTDTGRRILLFTPSGPLPANTTFTVTLSPGLRGSDGAQLAEPLVWSFPTGAPSASLANQIVYLSSRSGVSNLWAMNPDGSNQHQVSAELSPVTSYAVAPDGRSYVVGDGARLIEEAPDGSDRRVLTQAGDIEYDPAYAPDGSAIVFGRADAATGSGLGLWKRAPSGGPARAIVVPDGSGGVSASPAPTPSGSAAPAASAPLLRAPRFSPDGRKLAFVDASGRIGILDLDGGALTAASYHATSPPAWLPDSGGIIVSGLAQPPGQATWATGVLTAGTPVAPLTPAGLRLSTLERLGLQVVELDDGLSLAQVTPLVQGASLPTVGPDGRIAYVVMQSGDPEAGSLWIAAPGGLGSIELSTDSRALARGVSFAPETGTLVVVRQAVVEEGPAGTPPPSQSPGASAGETSSPTASPVASVRPATGIWLIDAQGGIGRQLTSDGWLARWLP
jgi:Tol biopolymer transport system component